MRHPFCSTLFLLALALTGQQANAYINGAPACISSPPNAGVHAPTSPFDASGYALTVTPAADGTATVTVSGPEGAKLGGISIVASTGTLSIPPSTYGFQVKCDGRQVTHTDGSFQKALPFTFLWSNTAASVPGGVVTFDYTVLQYMHSWVHKAPVTYTIGDAADAPVAVEIPISENVVSDIPVSATSESSNPDVYLSSLQEDAYTTPSPMQVYTKPTFTYNIQPTDTPSATPTTTTTTAAPPTTPTAATPSTDTTTVGAPVPPTPSPLLVSGCCYDVGFGAYMVPVYANYADVADVSSCPVQERMGGATRFQQGVDCQTLKAQQSGEQTNTAGGGVVDVYVDETPTDMPQHVEIGNFTVPNFGVNPDAYSGIGPAVTDTSAATTGTTEQPAEESTTTTTTTTTTTHTTKKAKAGKSTTKKAVKKSTAKKHTTKKASTKKATTKKAAAPTTTTTTLAASFATTVEATFVPANPPTALPPTALPPTATPPSVSANADGAAETYPLPPSSNTPVQRVAVPGCCYNVGFGAYMVPVYANYADVADVSSCPVHERMGGATRFQQGVDCQTLKAQQSGEQPPVSPVSPVTPEAETRLDSVADTIARVTEINTYTGVGPNSEGGAQTVQEETTTTTTHTTHTTEKAAVTTKKTTKKATTRKATTKKPTTKKPTTKAPAATTTATLTTTTLPPTTPSTAPPSAPTTAAAIHLDTHGPADSTAAGAAGEGCCYNVGFGAYMRPMYGGYTDVSDVSHCPVEERRGGATRFEAGVDCASLEAKHNAAAENSYIPVRSNAEGAHTSAPTIPPPSGTYDGESEASKIPVSATAVSTDEQEVPAFRSSPPATTDAPPTPPPSGRRSRGNLLSIRPLADTIKHVTGNADTTPTDATQETASADAVGETDTAVVTQAAGETVVEATAAPTETAGAETATQSEANGGLLGDLVGGVEKSGGMMGRMREFRIGRGL